MGITSSLVNTFKAELMRGGHNFGASGDTPAGDAFKIALYTNSTTIDTTTTVYGGQINSLVLCVYEKVLKKWDSEFNEPINVVLGDEWNAGNLSYHLKSRPAWEGELDKSKLDSYNTFICIDNICVGNK